MALTNKNKIHTHRVLNGKVFTIAENTVVCVNVRRNLYTFFITTNCNFRYLHYYVQQNIRICKACKVMGVYTDTVFPLIVAPL